MDVEVRWMIQMMTPDGWLDVKSCPDYRAARKKIHAYQEMMPKAEFRYVHEQIIRMPIPQNVGDTLIGKYYE